MAEFQLIPRKVAVAITKRPLRVRRMCALCGQTTAHDFYFDWHGYRFHERCFALVKDGAPEAPTYPHPPDGWVCFHCGQRFKRFGAALIHFGPTPISIPSCQLTMDASLLLDVVRTLEQRVVVLEGELGMGKRDGVS